MAFDTERYLRRYEEEKQINIYFLPINSADGSKHYMYAAASHLMHEKFVAAIEYNQVPDFAVIVAQGNGDPTEETKQKMKQCYGFDHDAYAAEAMALEANGSAH